MAPDSPITPLVEHGGSDAAGPIRCDFSTNVNPLGPPSAVTRALSAVDRHRYPDPAYCGLRERIAESYGTDPARVVPTAGTSEAIRRLSLAAKLRGLDEVWLPQPGYGDYAAAAAALGLRPRTYADAQALLVGLKGQTAPALVWICEPHSPSGASIPPEVWRAIEWSTLAAGHWVALDRAYEPLRLHGRDPVPAGFAARCWQCWSPNKALGLPGVRAGFVLAPSAAAAALVQGLAPSWVLSADGVRLLEVWTRPATACWLAEARAALGDLSQRQARLLAAMGLRPGPQRSVTPYALLRLPPEAVDRGALAALRQRGIKLRDARSFGLPGWVRVSTRPPAEQDALAAAWGEITAHTLQEDCHR